MRLALWTAEPQRWARLPLAGGIPIALVGAAAAERPAADLDVYHLRDDPAFGFVLRALAQRPGIVVLEGSGLHSLVHAETAGRGDPAGYLLAARRSAGARGAFVARQVLRGLAGALVPLLPLLDPVLDGAVAVIADAAGATRLAPLLRGRSLVVKSLQAEGSAAVAETAVALARELQPRLAERRATLEARALGAGTARARALAELSPLARELGLPELPDTVRRAVASLFTAAGAGAASAR